MSLSELFCFLFLSLQVKIKEATGLPLNLSNFVFCQYTFWDQCESTVAAPVVDPEVPSPQSRDAQYTVTFSHCKVWALLQDGLHGDKGPGCHSELFLYLRSSPTRMFNKCNMSVALSNLKMCFNTNSDGKCLK